MSRPLHPQIEIPTLGLRDHAWDGAGPWHLTIGPPRNSSQMTTIEAISAPATCRGVLHMPPDWEDGVLHVPPHLQSLYGWPPSLVLHRVGDVEYDPVAGGGTMVWTGELRHGFQIMAEFRCLLWPGELFLRLWSEGMEKELATLTGSRPLAYWRAKYP